MGLCLFPDSSYLEQIGSDMKYDDAAEKEKLQFEIVAYRETYDKVLAERVQMVKELARARHMMDWYAKLFEEASLKVTQHATELAAARKTIEEMREALEKAREGISASYEEAFHESQGNVILADRSGEIVRHARDAIRAALAQANKTGEPNASAD